MIKLLGIAMLAVLTGSAAQASIITFGGAIAQEGDAQLSFDGRVDDSTGTGTVSVTYFFNNPTQPGPIFGSETITGAASFFQANQAFPPGGLELQLKVTGSSSFELRQTTLGGLTLAFADPSRNIDVVDQAVLTSFAVSNVPLPPSAPMFGAALLGLGTLGSCLRRRSRPMSDLRCCDPTLARHDIRQNIAAGEVFA